MKFVDSLYLFGYQLYGVVHILLTKVYVYFAVVTQTKA